MKGTFFQRPLEYNVFTQGEEWSQGDRLQGTLRVKNLGNAPVSLDAVQIVLTYGITKLIKAKEPDAWQLVESQTLAEDLTLDANAEQEYSWEFALTTDSPITDKNGSLYLRYGGSNAAEEGKIDLRVRLSPFIQSFIQTFSTQFAFVQKTTKPVKGFTEVKFVPPDSKNYPTLDYVMCLLRIIDDVLEVNYKFKRKSFGREGSSEKLKVVNKRTEIQQSFPPEQYSMGGFPNRDCFKNAITAAMEEAHPKSIL